MMGVRMDVEVLLSDLSILLGINRQSGGDSTASAGGLHRKIKEEEKEKQGIDDLERKW